MHGTWKVAGFGGGGVALVVAAAVAAFAGVAWVLTHILWILGTGVLCAVLTGVAVARLAAWSDEHDARVWAQRPERLRAEPVPQVSRAERPAIGPVYHFNFYGPAGDTHAAVIRKAITGADVAPPPHSPYPGQPPGQG